MVGEQGVFQNSLKLRIITTSLCHSQAFLQEPPTFLLQHLHTIIALCQ